jgi:hypothetical protein
MKKQPAAPTAPKSEVEQAEALLKEVQSSNITRIGYSPVKETLYIEFHGGRVYAYDSVPEKTYRELASAPSAGTFLNQVVKPKFSFRLLTGGTPKAKKAGK